MQLHVKGFFKDVLPDLLFLLVVTLGVSTVIMGIAIVLFSLAEHKAGVDLLVMLLTVSFVIVSFLYSLYLLYRADRFS